jgi:SAM-dependent methyltransferase
MDRETQRRLGAWYTPPALVDFVLGRVISPRVGGPVRVLDPSCGDGRFLVAAGEELGSRAVLHGLDIDANAVSATRVALPKATIVEGDALGHDWGSAHFDVVVGNPPFLGQMARRTSRGGRSAHGGGPYADTAALFLSLALRLARPDGGFVALVLPQSILATRDAGPIRAAVAADAALVDLWVAGEPMFDAAVHTIVAVFRRGHRQGVIRRWFGPSFEQVAPINEPSDLSARSSWSFLVADLAGVPHVSPTTSGTVGDLATVTADFRDQYYGLVGSVGDDVEGPALITSGLIDVARSHWGTRPTKFAKQRYLAPRVDVAALSPKLQTWAASRLVPKVLMATQTKVIEAIADPEGQLLPSVPVISIVPHLPSDVWRVLAVLLAPSTSAWAATAYLGAGLSSSALKLSASQVRTLPLPSRAWDSAIAPLQAGDLPAFACAMNAAFEVPDEPVTSWWLDRV